MKRVLEAHGPAAAFLLSDDEVAAIGGGRKTFPVAVTAGDYAFRGRLARMGGQNMIGLSRAVRDAGGLEIGAEYDVEVVADDAPREVEMPPALAEVRDAFEALSYTRRKEIARSITEAKKPETRERRVAKAIEGLRG